MRIAAGERVLVVGPSGWGKSNFEAWMFEGLSSVVIFDSKMAPEEWTAWGPRNGYVVTKDAADISRHPKVIYQPSQISLMDVQGWRKPGTPGWRWTEALQRAWSRKRTTVVFDETVQTLPAGKPHPIAMRLYTQGRAFGITCWAGTQIANRIETLTARMADHCFAFHLNPSESKILCQARGVEAGPLGELEKFHFAHHGTGESAWTTYSPVPLVPGWGVRNATVSNSEEEGSDRHTVALTGSSPQPE